MSDKQLSKLANLFEGFKLQLKNEGEYFSNLSDHNGEKGRLNESHLKKVLRQHLPEKYGIGTGFIVSNKSLAREDNPQLDIIIYDKINNAPLYQSDTFGIYPIEMVYAYIEVKTKLTKARIKQAFEVNKKIRSLTEDKNYERTKIRHWAPRFYIFAYKSEPNDKTKIAKIIEDGFRKIGHAHAHGIYLLDKDMLIARKALHDANKVEIIKWSDDFTFARFITNLVSHCETMTPENYISFPRANIPKYFEQLP